MKCTCPECGHEFEAAQNYGGIDTPIRRARREKGLSVDQAALGLAISPHTLRALERGKMDPRLSVIQAAVKLYGKSVDELFPADAETPEGEVELVEFTGDEAEPTDKTDA